MTNYTALAAYETAIAHYHDVARQYQPKPEKVSNLDAVAYNAVHEACASRLGKPSANDPGAPLLTPEDLVTCLRRLRKSVEFWTKQGGRRGYLDFVAGYV